MSSAKSFSLEESKICHLGKVNHAMLTLSQTKKISDVTKLKAFANDKLNVARLMISILDRIENIVEKRRKCQ